MKKLLIIALFVIPSITIAQKEIITFRTSELRVGKWIESKASYEYKEGIPHNAVGVINLDKGYIELFNEKILKFIIYDSLGFHTKKWKTVNYKTLLAGEEIDVFFTIYYDEKYSDLISFQNGVDCYEYDIEIID